MNSLFQTFSILDHIDKLTPAKEKGRYICPVCEGNNFTISKNGAYQCWNGCECREIREAIAPLHLDRTARLSPTRAIKRLKAKPKPAIAIPPTESIFLAMLPSPSDDSPLPQKRFDPKLGEVIETIYRYSQTQWVVRTQWADASREKGYRKTFSQWHLAQPGESIQVWENGQKVTREATGGESIPTKGLIPWQAYRIDEALAAVKAIADIPALLHLEGEKGVEIARARGIAAVTFQGSTWDSASLERYFTQLKNEHKSAIAVLLKDNDAAGQKKGEAFKQAAQIAGVLAVAIDPVAISPNIPDKGDVEEILAEMDTPEFIRRLEEEIHKAVDGAREQIEEFEASSSIPDSLDPDTEFTQRALNFLYGDKPWICASDKLYYWTGSYYKYSPDAVERPKIASFCNSYPVQQKDGSIRYPYAKPSKVREALQWVKDRLEIDPNLLNPPGLNCTNGVLELGWNGETPSWRLVDHAPTLYYTYEPIATYDPNADSQDCDRLLAALDFPQREIFLRTIAASLDLPTVRMHKGRLVRGLLLKGDGSNGKDSLREVVAAMYGYKGMTGCTLTDFKAYDDGRKFPLSRLRLSRINWATENANTAKLDKIQSIKAYITGDSLSSEGKGKDEEDFTPNGVGLFNVNDTPNLQASLEAITSRWGVLTFTKTFKIGADPLKGEIEADPRFKYDPEFLKQQVLPAFLNRVLAALVDLMRDGIDFSCTQKALLDIQAENSHLFQFCQQMGLGYDPNGTVGIGELWERLKAWYMDNGTLTIEVSDKGKEKNVWLDQVRSCDANVKGANQILARFLELFPKAKRCHMGNNKMGIQGLAFGISHFSPEISQPLGSELVANSDTAREISQLSQFWNSNEKNETEACDREQSERTELNALVGGEQVTQLASMPNTVSDTASIVANPLPNQSPNLANAAASASEATTNNVPSPSAVAAQILQCQTWVEIAQAVANNGEKLNRAAQAMTNQQRCQVARLLENHFCSDPVNLKEIAWIPEKLRLAVLQKLIFTIRKVADGSLEDARLELVSDCKFAQINHLGKKYEQWLFQSASGTNIPAYVGDIENICTFKE